jgi:regulator of sirC expression with transglutaminase-like and TPR domain
MTQHLRVAEKVPHRFKAREDFARAVRRPDAGIDLFISCLLIAAEEYPELEIDSYVAKVSGLCGMVRDRLPAAPSMYDTIHLTGQVLFRDCGLRGNSENYYDPRNSFVNEVLDRGLGIPITLSIVYMEVATRAGLKLRGIGMPGHFLLAAGSGEEEIFIDPYHNGGLLSRKECVNLALRGRPMPNEFQTTMVKRLLPANSNRSILRRLLTNLKLTYAKQRDYRRSLGCAERIQLLDPDNWRNLSDLARLQAEVGEFLRAVESLSAFLERAPEGADTRRAEDALRQLKQLAQRSDIPDSATS